MIFTSGSLATPAKNSSTVLVVFLTASSVLIAASIVPDKFCPTILLNDLTAPLASSLLVTGFPYSISEEKFTNLDHFHDFCLHGQAVRRDGSAALDLCYVSCGRFDGFWELALKPWDTAAGALIVAEAGGRVTKFDGQPFDIQTPECLASNGRIHEEMIAVLAKRRS